jgi:hypothetical protein
MYCFLIVRRVAESPRSPRNSSSRRCIHSLYYLSISSVIRQPLMDDAEWVNRQKLTEVYFNGSLCLCPKPPVFIRTTKFLLRRVYERHGQGWTSTCLVRFCLERKNKTIDSETKITVFVELVCLCRPQSNLIFWHKRQLLQTQTQLITYAMLWNPQFSKADL